MRRKTLALAAEEDLLIDLTFHKISASLVAGFKERVVDPDYDGNLNAAIQTLIFRALAEQNFGFSQISSFRNKNNH